MYKLSSALHQLQRRYSRRGDQELLALHAYRYKFFVDSSPRGRHCRYATATIKMYLQDEEQEPTRQWLQQLVPPPPQLEQLLELL